MTPVESFRWLLAIVLVANWCCGFVATCAAGYGPEWRGIRRLSDLGPAIWSSGIQALDRAVRRALRIRRRIELSVDPTKRKLTAPIRWIRSLFVRRRVVAARHVEPHVVETAEVANVQLGELRTTLSHWRAWSSRRRSLAAELDRLAGLDQFEFDNLRAAAERLRASVGEADPDWNVLFDRLNAVEDDDLCAALRDGLRAYRRDAKLLAAAAWAAASGVKAERAAAGRAKVQETLAREAAALDRTARSAFVQTAKILANVRVRDAASTDLDHATSVVDACLWASRNLGFPFSIALVEPIYDAGSSASARASLVERLRAELSATSGFDDRLVEGTEPFVVLFAPATSGRAFAGRLETQRAAWADAAATNGPGRRASDGFVGRVQATVGTPNADDDLFAFFSRLVDSHESTVNERSGRVAYLEGGAVTVVDSQEATAPAESEPSLASAEPAAALSS